MYRIAFFVVFSCVSWCCGRREESRLPYFTTPDFEPHFISGQAEIDRKITHKISDFAFRNQHGEIVSDSVIDGKIHVANFIFTSCGSICPTMTNHMKLVNDAFGNDSSVVMLSYSVTPWIDDVPTLKSYTERNNISSDNWHFLTGKKSEIYSLARQSYFAEEDLGFTRDSTEFLHTEHFILVDPDKRIRGIYNGTLALDIQQLIRDIQLLKSIE
jgi:protein SCO1/2